jgi:hypothetical protein
MAAEDILNNPYIDETMTQDSGYTDKRIPEILRGKADYILVQRELGVSGVSAMVDIGAGENGVVTIAVDEAGSDGNDYTVGVVEGDGNDVALSASITDGDITVTLATDGTGALDDTANTATLVTAEVDGLTGVSATASGDGSTALDNAEGPKNFAGGVDATAESDIAKTYQIIKTPNDDKYNHVGSVHHFIENNNAGSYDADINVLSISLNGKWLRNF